MGIPLPKGFKLPQGMSFKEAQRAMAATSECVNLVGALVALDDDLGHVVKAYILAHSDAYPILADGLRNEVQQ